MAKLVVFYDGTCGICKQTMNWFRFFDVFKNLRYVDYHQEEDRNTLAPEIPYEQLDHAMHVKSSSGHYTAGFYAFRSICRYATILLPLWPFLYVPGVPFVGQTVYAHIAKRRRCTAESCNV